jgi:hypothetical protein
MIELCPRSRVPVITQQKAPACADALCMKQDGRGENDHTLYFGDLVLWRYANKITFEERYVKFNLVNDLLIRLI